MSSEPVIFLSKSIQELNIVAMISRACALIISKKYQLLFSKEAGGIDEILQNLSVLLYVSNVDADGQSPLFIQSGVDPGDPKSF